MEKIFRRSEDNKELLKCTTQAIGLIEIPEGIETIKCNAFENCCDIESVVIPSSVKKIEENAFKGCINLKTISIPDSVNIIPAGCFNGCIELTKVELPSTITKISNDAFSNCCNLIDILISDVVTEIGSSAFHNCSNLCKIQIPDSVIEIGPSAFEGCRSLESINLSQKIKYINCNTFRGCELLNKIWIPKNVAIIGSEAFGGCENMSIVAIQSNHIKIDPTAFLQCSNISRLYLANNNPNVVISSFGDSVAIKIISPISDYDRIKSSASTSAEDLYKTHATNLKYMALFYKYMGMNITQMKWSESLKNAKSFKEPINTSWEAYKTIEQSIEELFSINWDYSAGLGLVLGYNNFRALDFDINGDFAIKLEYNDGTVDDFIDDVLRLLNLPLDYQWVVRSGNGYGFHIIFRCENIPSTSELDSISFAPSDRYSDPQLFSRIELRWCDHLVLPPSIHASGNQYYFRNKKLPTINPVELTLDCIEPMLYKYCGDRIYQQAQYKGRQLTLTQVEKITSRHDSYLSPHEHCLDSIEYLSDIITPEGQNSLAIHYLLGDGIAPCIEKGIDLLNKSNTQSAMFNLLSLYSVGAIPCTYYQYKNLLDQLDRNSFNEDSISLIEENASNFINKTDLFFFFDTETTGLPADYNAPISKTDNWPHIIQIAWVVMDESNKVVTKNDFVLKPDGFDIPSSSVDIHGITFDYAMKNGVGIAEVIEKFLKDLSLCKYVVGHNIKFDQNILSAQLYRMNMNIDWNKFNSICTMKSSVNFCKITGMYGYKYPKLNELYYKLFHRNFENAHNAFSDVLATIECFKELKKKGVIDMSDDNDNLPF